jgi:Zn-dependent oligopeptidase
MRPVRTLVLLLSLVVLAFAAVGCGGGGGGDDNGSESAAAPDVWAASVCGALGNWVKSLQDGSRRLGTQMRDTKDLKTVKARFVSFLEDAEQSSEEMVEKVKEAGPPDVEQGEAIQEDLVAAFEKVNQSFSNAVDKANELSTNNLQSFSSGVGKLSQDVQNNLATTGQDFSTLSDRFQSSELDNATDGEPACQQFASG